MRTLQKLMLLSGNSGGASAPAFELVATTTAPAQTVTLQQINPTGQDVTLDWGDGTVGTIADGNTLAKSHQYAAAGAYTIRLPYVEYETVYIVDSKVGGTVDANNPFPAVTGSVRLENLPNLTWAVDANNPFPAVTSYVYLNTLPNLTWTVDANNPFPAVASYVSLNNLPNLTWAVDANNPFPAVTSYVYLNTLPNLTWVVDSNNPFPAVANGVTLENLPNLTWVVDSNNPFPAVANRVWLTNLPNLTWNSGAAANLHSVSLITYESNLLAGAVDTVLADLYSVFPARTKVGDIDMLGGGNAAPTGVSPGSAECPPTNGWNTAYELVNDTCGISNFHWTSVSLQV